MAATPDERPTLLVVGQGDPMQHALEAALARYALVEGSAKSKDAVTTTLAAAPDALVLVGKAAADHATVLKELGRHPVTAVVPVVLLTNDTSLTAKLDAVRRGVGVVPRTASVDGMARAIVRSAVSLADDETPSTYEAASVDEIIDIVRRELGGGVLSIKDDRSASSLVVKPGVGVDQAIRDFVSRLRPMVVETDTDELSFEFHGGSKGRFGILDTDSAGGDLSILKGRRLLLIEENPARADHLAQELRAHGALVAVVDEKGTGLDRARSTDPEVVLMSEHLFSNGGVDVISDIRRDTLLRWASSLVVRHEDFAITGQAPRTDRLAGSITPLLTVDRELEARAKAEDAFDTRLEPIGPSRMLRALANSGKTLHIVVRHSRVVIEIDLAEGVIAGVEAVRMDASRRIGGLQALAALLAIGSARVSVEKRQHPASANMLMPIDEALIAASLETPPIRPSIPAISAGTEGPVIPASPKVPNLNIPLTTSETIRTPAAVPRTRAPGPPDKRIHTKPPSKPVPPLSMKAISKPVPPLAKPSVKAAPAVQPVESKPKVKRSPPKRVKTMVFGSQSITPVAASDESKPQPKKPAPAKPTPKRPTNDPDRTGPWDSLNETDIPAAPVPTNQLDAAGIDPLAQTMLPGTAEAPSIADMIEESAHEPAARGILARDLGEDDGLDASSLVAASSPVVAPLEPVQSFPSLGEEASSDSKRKWLPWLLGAVFIGMVSLAAWFAFSGDDETPKVAGATGEAATTEEKVVRLNHKSRVSEMAASMKAPSKTPSKGPAKLGSTEMTSDGPEDTGETLTPFEALLKAGNYHRSVGNHSRAMKKYKRALSIQPRSGRVLAGLVRTASAQGKRKEAVVWARKLVQARPSAPNFTLYGDMLKKAGDKKASCGAYSRALSSNKRYQRARRRLARCR